MTDTQLLNYIRKEMQRQGVAWKKEQELFEMLVPSEDWKSYRTSWSNWKKMNVHFLTKSPNIRVAISKTLFFDPNIWDSSSAIQKEAIEKGVTRAFVNISTPLPNLEKIIPTFSMNDKQKKLLSIFPSLSLPQIEETLLTHSDFISRSLPNQNFLLELLEILYARGAYDILIEHLFPNLLSYNRGKLHIKIMEAHTLGSLDKPRYMESVKLLDSIETSEEYQIIDLKTSMLSNLRREHIKDMTLGYDVLVEGMRRMGKMYYELFCYAERYHYYPAINLLYIEVLRTILPNEKSLIDRDELYNRAKASIAKDKKSKSSTTLYYASITEFEFLLLLGDENIVQKMTLLLESLMPLPSLVERTKRQMIEFISMTERVKAPLPKLIGRFNKVIELLEDYEISICM